MRMKQLAKYLSITPSMALVASLAALPLQAQLRWTSSEQHPTQEKPTGLQWKGISHQHSEEKEPASPHTVHWRINQPEDVIKADEILEQNKIAQPLLIIEPSGATFANDKAIWRDEQWHPQISSTVPVGFGPKGVMATAGIWGIDCTASGICEKPNNWDDMNLHEQRAYADREFEKKFSCKYIDLINDGHDFIL